jgi:hypothetical protein
MLTMARVTEAWKLFAATRLRSRYQARVRRYSASASGWNSIGLLAIQTPPSLLLNVLPRHRPYFACLQLCRPANDLLLPRGLHIFINPVVQTLNEIAGKLSAVFVRQGKRLFKQFQGLVTHRAHYIADDKLRSCASVLCGEFRRYGTISTFSVYPENVE